MVEIIAYQTESWLYKDGDHLFRVLPFWELEYNEFIIFENGKHKYFVTFEWEDSPIVKQLMHLIVEQKYNIEDAFQHLGEQVGLKWTTRTNIPGEEVENSQQMTTVTLYLLKDLKEVTGGSGGNRELLTAIDSKGNCFNRLVYKLRMFLNL